LLVKRALFLWNEAFAMAILDLISQVLLSSFADMLPKCLKYSTFSSTQISAGKKIYFRYPYLALGGIEITECKLNKCMMFELFRKLQSERFISGLCSCQ
jgi:hypothetical protein